ncbi:hypothetical protein ASE17_09300 [Phenylobacterium sp. Root77]|uniref:BrnA antitoxin family protein n=1 Tax=unclassified Phenylobacterium TaxID=2640670 RepID=UPI0006FC69E8|nr:MULTISPECIES: BrnA antitoxin family protein [unclassified Phenylobacterium]KQW73135.1 hypothetical protein ASC73_01870 [Phenylobacterium sp. Root1277]KQW92354.1 hypothetical protein ASC79_12580 [Phenylobacterium sp. Root1290]KRC40585.1 hypothetical protein ASE17_09300 [Phenylobacterium sp. Root77]
MIEKKSVIERAWVDSDDAPEWADDVFERAEVREDDRIIRPASGTLTKRGRPKLENPKQQVTIRLDSDLVELLRATGPGWQSRINELLRKAVKV